MKKSFMCSFHAIIILITLKNFYLKYGGWISVNESAEVIFSNLFPVTKKFNRIVDPSKVSSNFSEKKSYIVACMGGDKDT